MFGLSKCALHAAVGKRLLSEANLETCLAAAVISQRPVIVLDTDRTEVLKPADFLNAYVFLTLDPGKHKAGVYELESHSNRPQYLRIAAFCQLYSMFLGTVINCLSKPIT